MYLWSEQDGRKIPLLAKTIRFERFDLTARVRGCPVENLPDRETEYTLTDLRVEIGIFYLTVKEKLNLNRNKIDLTNGHHFEFHDIAISGLILLVKQSAFSL